MATASDSLVTVGIGGFPALGSKVGVVECTIDLPTVSAELVAQGDGVLATGDIIQAISLPAGTVILSAGIQIEETVAGVAALPVSLGVTGIDPNAFIDAVDIGASTSYVATDYIAGVGGGADGSIVIGTGAAGATSDTLDILCGTVSATSITAGILRVWAVIASIGDLEG